MWAYKKSKKMKFKPNFLRVYDDVYGSSSCRYRVKDVEIFMGRRRNKYIQVNNFMKRKVIFDKVLIKLYTTIYLFIYYNFNSYFFSFFYCYYCY